MSDIFDDVLNLEEQYHREGYDSGYRDGAEAGRVEGRSVGLKQGYEKFREAARLQGRAVVWANRIPRLRGNDAAAAAGDGDGENNGKRSSLPDLPSNARLEKNVATLHGMVEPGTLSTRNDDEAVNDFDSRLKGAQGKLKIIDRVIGEKITVPAGDGVAGAAAAPGQGGAAPAAAKNSNIEDSVVGRLPAGNTASSTSPAGTDGK